MTPEQFRRIEQLFHELKDLPPGDQQARLDGACADHPDVRREVESLLAQADPDETLQDLRSKVDEILRPGQQEQSFDETGRPVIEGYEIIRELHRGGQGVVYQALQKSTRRKVAIKVLIEGPYASEMSKRRFEREIELVASLNHPRIVPVFDSGLTHGKYWFAMDFIRGRQLDQYVADSHLSIIDSLRLFVKVCEAITYAHQHGVIHRDLKPGNVLVDEAGEPHVLDFGLAKVAGMEREGPASITGQVMGTLPYMSPEQTKGDPHLIDIRTDVYSLGVILYELLTGKYPYTVIGQMADVLRNIAETEPHRPSTFKRQINDEVETIILKALAKEPDRRYQSARHVAEDIQRFLNGEPIEAKRDRGFYVIKKTLRRYKGTVRLASSILLIILCSSVALFVMYKQAEEARQHAVKSREAAEQARDGESQQRKLADRRYEELIRLADLKRLADARTEADALWPAEPAEIAAMQTWLATKAAPLRENLPKHKATLSALRERALDYTPQQHEQDRQTHPRAAELAEKKREYKEILAQLEQVEGNDPERAETRADNSEDLEERRATLQQEIDQLDNVVGKRRTWAFGDDQVQWQHDTLAGLVADLTAFVNPENGTVADVEKRLAFASSIEERSITGPEAAKLWEEARADIVRSEVYGGLQLKPQMGLLPLRRDPRSGLWEFWHIQTGERPEPNPDEDAVNPWILTGETGLVLVLIPGGTFEMGAQKDDPEGVNYDPQAEINESAVHKLTLAPFFISRYEMTQGQWHRVTGANPSQYGPDWTWKGNPPGDEPIHQNRPWNPVESISWLEAQETLAHVALTLPTEAQWEYAARAGTNTVWWTGNEVETLNGTCNLADGGTQRHGGPAGWVYEDWLEDGWVIHAPVGSFRANAFGLHDIVGNVREWCMDAYGRYNRETAPGNGLRGVTFADKRIFRGGSFGFPATDARSADRLDGPPTLRSHDVGLRPAKAIAE